MRLFHRKEVWLPTWQGALLGLLLAGGGAVFLTVEAEDFLSPTRRVAADVLVVEGWISKAGLEEAYREFSTGGYAYVVPVGGWTASAVTPVAGPTYAGRAAAELARLGCPASRMILAAPAGTDTDRTFEQARSARDQLARRGIRPKGIVVFTADAHGRRSRLVYRRMFGSGVAVGVVSYQPPEARLLPWWKDTARAKDVLVEMAGWAHELCVSRPGAP